MGLLRLFSSETRSIVFFASNLFWINLGTGLLLTLAFAAAGLRWSSSYGNARVAHVAVGDPVILITSTSAALALLMRGMQFTLVSANDFVSRVCLGGGFDRPCLGRVRRLGVGSRSGCTASQPVYRGLGSVPLGSQSAPASGWHGFDGEVRADVYGRFTLTTPPWKYGQPPGRMALQMSGPGFYKKAYDFLPFRVWAP